MILIPILSNGREDNTTGNVHQSSWDHVVATTAKRMREKIFLQNVQHNHYEWNRK